MLIPEGRCVHRVQLAPEPLLSFRAHDQALTFAGLAIAAPPVFLIVGPFMVPVRNAYYDQSL